MNPYFDDQQSDTTADARADSGAPIQQEQQSPLLLQEMQSPEDLYAIPKKSQRPRQLVVAVVLVAGAVGAIFAMRQVGMGPALSLADVDMTYKPKTSANGITPGKVLADLERSRHAVQVPAHRITQDPFELEGSHAAAEDSTKIDPDLEARAERERLAKEAAARLKTIDDAFAKLKLQGVMGGSVPMARIDGQIYKVGMTVGEHFTVETIEGREVTLTANGHEYKLSMDSGR